MTDLSFGGFSGPMVDLYEMDGSQMHQHVIKYQGNQGRKEDGKPGKGVIRATQDLCQVQAPREKKN